MKTKYLCMLLLVVLPAHSWRIISTRLLSIVAFTLLLATSISIHAATFEKKTTTAISITSATSGSQTKVLETSVVPPGQWTIFATATAQHKGKTEIVNCSIAMAEPIGRPRAELDTAQTEIGQLSNMPAVADITVAGIATTTTAKKFMLLCGRNSSGSPAPQILAGATLIVYDATGGIGPQGPAGPQGPPGSPQPLFVICSSATLPASSGTCSCNSPARLVSQTFSGTLCTAVASATVSCTATGVQDPGPGGATFQGACCVCAP